jgi:hypothetical protein
MKYGKVRIEYEFLSFIYFGSIITEEERGGRGM